MKNYCPRCGAPFRNNDKFCGQCGHENPNFNNSAVNDIAKEKNIPLSSSELLQYMSPNQSMSSNQSVVNNNIPEVSESSKARSSLIIGVIALVFSFTFNMIGLILSIVGLINAVKVKKETPCRKIAITLNTIALVLSGIILIFSFSIFGLIFRSLANIEIDTTSPISDKSNIKNEIPVAGHFNCQSGSNSYDSGKYSMVLYLDNNNNFSIGTYGDLENNKATGTYTYKDLNKTNNSGNYKYYEVTLNGYEDSFIHNGEVQDYGYKTVIEFAITEKNGKKEGLVYFTPTSSMNYCFTK